MHRSRSSWRPFAARRLAAVGCAALATATVLAWAPAQAAVSLAPAHPAVPRPPDTRGVRISPTILRAERTASAKARAVRKKVIVSAETTTGSMVTANPNGTFTLTEDSSPARARQRGRWVPIDTTLSRRADGDIVPGATATGVVFSGGGHGPMAQLTQGSHALSFTFPVSLPAPSLSGSTAVYRDVLPSVDLRLTADATGFSELLVVKNRAAAANPELARLTSRLRTHGLRVRSVPGGTAAAVDSSGATVFHSDQAEMWDSAGASVPGAASATSGPARGGHMVRVAVATSSAAESITPDLALLRASTTRYPVYIDPTWSGNPSQLHWARISSNGWNIYDSTSTASTDHPRAGFDNWSGGAGEIARSYYQMNTGGSTGVSGIGGSVVTSADFYLKDDWAASGADTPVDLRLSCGPVANGWNSTDLNWGNKPCEGTDQGDLNSHETSSGVVPGTFAFNITALAQDAANANWPNITFEVRAPDESTTDGTARNQWKQFASGGGATISVTFMRRPDFVNGTGNPVTTPSTVDNGTTFVTSRTPTLKITAEDTDGEDVVTNYQIWQGSSSSPSTLMAQGEGPSSGYAINGGPWTDSTSLPDGVYEWRASATNPISPSNPQGLWSAWSAWHVFTIDTSPPRAPGVQSPQFPAGQYGAAFGAPGTFTFTTDGSDNVKGYMISLDGDLGTTVYNPAAPPPTWTGSGSPAPGKVYWLEADDGNGTGPEVTNGFASAAITPGSTGPHRIYAKAVDQAANTSAEQTYAFYAGITTPSYVYGDQLVNGYTAADGTSVPAAKVSSSVGAVLGIQPDCCSLHFADGKQAFLSGGSGGGAAPGDSVTMNFDVPTTGYWDLGASLTTAPDYGQYTLSLDNGGLTPATLIRGFDAYHSGNVVALTYRDFGIPDGANRAPIALTKGVHTLTLTVTGKDASSSGYRAGINVLRLAPVPPSCPITNLTGCYNNTAISPNNQTSVADADGSGDSLPADSLTSSGWAAGAAITIDGAPMTLPAYGVDRQDNITSAGQVITVPSTGVANDGTAIVFLGFATGNGAGGLSGFTGKITYTNGATQSYTLDNVPDWVNGPATAAALRLPGMNQAGNSQNTSLRPSIFAISVPLVYPGSSVASIGLPVVSDGVSGTLPALHILALGIRASSYVGATGAGPYPNTSNWTGTYAARQDSATGTLGTSTIRIPVHVSVGNGASAGLVRVHLANTLGSVPVTFDAASIAVQATGAAATAQPVQLTFNGNNPSVTIPAGGEATSDSLSFPVSQLSTLLVSLHLATSVTSTPVHGAAKTTAYVSASGTNAVMDPSNTSFTGTNATTMSAVPYLTGIDVTTSNNTGSLVLFGDQTINSDTASGDTNSTTADDLAGDLAAASGNNGAVPYGVLAEGQDSASNNLLPTVAGSATPQSALNPIARSILTAANIRTVLISTGTSDILGNEPASTIDGELAALAQQIRAFYADNQDNNTAGNLTVYVATIPPDARFTSAQENVRESVNKYILSSSGSYLNGNADGVIDFAAAVSSDGTDTGATVNPSYLSGGYPSNAYYRALAQQYITSTSTSVSVKPNVVRG